MGFGFRVLAGMASGLYEVSAGVERLWWNFRV